MKITHVNDELELSGESIIIRRRGVANILAVGLGGERTIVISSITSIQLKMGGFLPGYILFSYAGSKPFNGGIIEATQDPDAFIFAKKLNEQIEEFKSKVEEIMHSKKAATSGNQAFSLTDELMKLADMKDKGILSETEFEAAKTKLLV